MSGTTTRLRMSAPRKTPTSEPAALGAAARLFERPQGGDEAVLVQVDDGRGAAAEHLRELDALARSAGAEVLGQLTCRRAAPDARLYIGSGQARAVAEQVEATGADLVVVNHAISPGQQRNLEREVGVRVLDRTGLILDIFAQRARSHEGKLQVELAQLRHIASRLVRGWSHLERQKGGIGLRGPGETQLEMDRRMLGVRIRQLEARLGRVQRQRRQGRQARRKRELPAVSLVGYTNAGKSTLFNRLAEASVFAADQLFATLDTTLRRVETADGEPLILADTVGFIRDLPHELVAAFRSTLEEVHEADLLLHVVDASDPARDESIHQVNRVLEEIGADRVPRLLVYNKIDALHRVPRVDRDAAGEVESVWVSAATGAGLGELLEAAVERCGAARVRGRIRLGPQEGRLRARFFALGEVLDEQVDAAGHSLLEVCLPRRDLERLYRREGLHSEMVLAEAGSALRGAGGGL